MVGLSSKAKGKQRAIEPVDEVPRSSATIPQILEVTVRFTDGIADLPLSIDEKDTVSNVKRRIRQAEPQLETRKLRLIHGGKLFANGASIYQYIAELEARRKRLAESEEGNDRELKESNSLSDRPTVASAWLHCSIGAEMLNVDDDEDDTNVKREQIKPLRGFDRLAAAGFSEEDIANFRRTFHSQSTGNYLDVEPPGDDDDYEEHARALEEQWIDSLDSGGNASLSQSSTSTTILQGLLVGFFFPIMPFFFLREQHPAVFWEDGREQERMGSVVFSKRMQMALVLGFMINITFGMWRYLLAS